MINSLLTAIIINASEYGNVTQTNVAYLSQLSPDTMEYVIKEVMQQNYLKCLHTQLQDKEAKRADIEYYCQCIVKNFVYYAQRYNITHLKEIMDFDDLSLRQKSGFPGYKTAQQQLNFAKSKKTYNAYQAIMDLSVADCMIDLMPEIETEIYDTDAIAEDAFKDLNNAIIQINQQNTHHGEWQ